MANFISWLLPFHLLIRLVVYLSNYKCTHEHYARQATSLDIRTTSATLADFDWQHRARDLASHIRWEEDLERRRSFGFYSHAAPDSPDPSSRLGDVPVTVIIASESIHSELLQQWTTGNIGDPPFAYLQQSI